MDGAGYDEEMEYINVENGHQELEEEADEQMEDEEEDEDEEILAASQRQNERRQQITRDREAGIPNESEVIKSIELFNFMVIQKQNIVFSDLQVS